MRRRRANLKAAIYRSEENLLSADEEGEVRQPYRINSLMNMRPATSCSDLVLSFDGDEIRQKVIEECETTMSGIASE